MICSSCNKVINGIVKYCPYCGSEQYYSEAKSIYLRGIEIFDHGGGEPRAYFEKADALGFPPAANMIGACIELNVMGEYRNCVSYYERAAKEGSIAGMANLGRCQWTVEPVHDRAILDHNTEYWLTQAAERGFVDAMISLAVFYSLKKNAKENAKIAYKWICIAADKGSVKGKQLKMLMDKGIYTSLHLRGIEGVNNFAYSCDRSAVFRDNDLDAWEQKDVYRNISDDYDDSANPYREHAVEVKNSRGNDMENIGGIISTAKNISEGATQGAQMGSILPGVGTKIGAIVGGILGGILKK